MFGNWVIRRLIGLKVGQPIRTKEQVRELAELHGGKAGTPTMGGVLLLGSVVISTLLWARLTNHSIWLALFTIVYLGLLGFVDDYLKVTKKKSDGVQRRVKLVAQLALAGVVTAFFLLRPIHRGAGAGVVRAVLQGAGYLQPWLGDVFFLRAGRGGNIERGEPDGRA